MRSINHTPSLKTAKKREICRMQSLVESAPYKFFIDSCRTEKTKETYSGRLKAYLAFRKIESLDAILSEDQKKAQNEIIAYLIHMRKVGLSWQTRVITVAALKHFFEMNDVILNWKKISRFIGEKIRTVQDRGYTKEEIKKMLGKCDERKRVMIMILASTGMRIGALPPLQVKHLMRTEHDLYQIVVYSGTTSQYTTFCTPECTSAIDEYLAYRKRYGEIITPDSPLIREQFDKNDQFRTAKAKPLSQSTMMNIIKQVLLDAGIRFHTPELEGNLRKRKEVMQIHGLRKFYDTAATKAGVHPLYVEMLLGHDIQLKGSYFKPSVQDILTGNDKMLGYIAAINALTISKEAELEGTVVKLSREKDRIEELAKHHEQELEDTTKRLETRMNNQVQVFWRLLTSARGQLTSKTQREWENQLETLKAHAE